MSPGAGPLDTPSSLGLQPGTKVQLRKCSSSKCTTQDYTVADYQEYFNSHGDVLHLQVAFLGVLYVKDLLGRTYQLRIESLGDPVWMIKEMIEQYTDLPVHKQRLSYNGKPLEDDKTLLDYSIDYGDTMHLVMRLLGGALSCTGPQMMGIGAGGKIQQKIYEDKCDKRIWDLGAATVTNFQLLNALDFARVTNMRPPPSPITKETYDKQGIPWFEFYDEDLRQLQDPQGPARFQNLKTLNLSPEVMLRDILVLALGKDLSDRSNLPCAQYGNQEKGKQREVSPTEDHQRDSAAFILNDTSVISSISSSSGSRISTHASSVINATPPSTPTSIPASTTTPDRRKPDGSPHTKMKTAPYPGPERSKMKRQLKLSRIWAILKE